MSDHGPTDTDLASLDRELAQLRQDVRMLREQLADSATGATEPEERAAMFTHAEEQDALISALERRRERLLRQMGASPD